jgi:hypothetical protein
MFLPVSNGKLVMLEINGAFPVTRCIHSGAVNAAMWVGIRSLTVIAPHKAEGSSLLLVPKWLTPGSEFKGGISCSTSMELCNAELEMFRTQCRAEIDSRPIPD